MLRYDECFRSVKDLEHLDALLLKEMLKEAKNAVVRIPFQYNAEITTDPAADYAGWNCVRSPFQNLCVELEGGFVHENHRCQVFAFFCGKNNDVIFNTDYSWLVACLAIGVRLGEPNALFAYPTIFKGFDDKGVSHSIGNDFSDVWRPLDGVARNILDFLSTPSIQIEPEPGMKKINRSRRKSGKPPLTNYHIIKWSTHTAPTMSTGQGSKHCVRYDVRGHFATYTRGSLAGRRIWKPAHQRGLANDVFRQKGYLR